MARARNMDGIYKRLAEFARERRAFVEAMLAEVAARGPISASELGRRERRSNGWWSWDEGKLALEYLFWAGLVTTATRRGAFERVYDLTERVVPRATQEAPTPTEVDAMHALVQIAAGALGVATAADLRDYFRLPLAETRRAVAELVESGVLTKVAVKGWSNELALGVGHPLARQTREVDNLKQPKAGGMTTKHDSPILVTGAAGAVGGIGRRLTEFLLARGYKVRALVRREDDRAALGRVRCDCG
jgi:uncharacterized protein